MASLRIRQILLEVVGDSDESDGSVWDRLCVAATKAVPVTGAGVALMSPEGHGNALAASDGPAALLGNLQNVLGEGPWLDAVRDGGPVLHSDLAGTGLSRWPEFVPAAVEAGIAAAFAFPLQVGGIRLGVLGLYRDAVGPLDTLELGEALDFAAAATMILLDLQHESSAGHLHPQLAEVTDNGRQIHQATGMISVQAAVGLTEALLLLRAHAYARERPLLQVAKDVVNRLVTFDLGGDDD